MADLAALVAEMVVVVVAAAVSVVAVQTWHLRELDKPVRWPLSRRSARQPLVEPEHSSQLGSAAAAAGFVAGAGASSAHAAA